MLARLLSTAWWALLLRGLIAIVFGILALASPGLTLATLVLYFAAFAFVDGVFDLVGAFSGGEGNEHRWLLLLEGFAGIAFGALAWQAPAITALVLLMYIAAFAIMTGVLRIVMAIRLRKEIEGEWLMALSGVAGVAFGGFMMARPGAGALAVMWYIGTWALVVGLALVLLAVKARRRMRPAHAL